MGHIFKKKIIHTKIWYSVRYKQGHIKLIKSDFYIVAYKISIWNRICSV